MKQLKTTSLTDRLVAKLRKLGVGDRKAKELAKGLAPMVRAAAKVFPEKSKAAPLKLGKGEALLSLPVIKMEGATGLEVLRVMHGLSSKASYLVAAIKGEAGLIAVRNYGNGSFNVKFYPTMAYWNKTEAQLALLGAESFLQREWYERARFDEGGLTKLLGQLAGEAKPKSRMKTLVDHVTSVTVGSLLKAFDHLQRWAVQAA